MDPSFVDAFVLLILLGFAFFMYACILADPETSKIAHFWTERLPNSVGTKFQNLIGPRIVGCLLALANRFLMIVYLVLVLGSWSIIFKFGYPWATESTHVASIHKYIGYFLFVVCMSSWRYALNVDPGIITKTTIAKFDHFPYDNVLFVANRICPTAGIRKLARSKYDRFSGQHIARFDHYCGWLNIGLGEENYRFFLCFLVVHVVMCSYGAFMTAKLFWGEVIDKDLLNMTIQNVYTGKRVAANWMTVAQYLFRGHVEMAFVMLLMCTMTLVLGVFLGFHIWITSRGMTTNEAAKWKQVKNWHKQELKRYKKAIKAGTVAKIVAESNGSRPVVSDGSVGCTGPIKSEIQNGPDPWEHTIADPGPMPTNLYDNGFIENWKEVLFPRSLRKDAIDRWTRSLDGKGSQCTESSEVLGKPKAD